MTSDASELELSTKLSVVTPLEGTKKSLSGKLGKKSGSTRSDLVHADEYHVGDIVFARVKGHPYWPAKVLNDKSVPQHYLNDRKSQKELSVMFYGTFQYGFVTPDALVPFGSNCDKLSIHKSKPIARAIEQARNDPSIVDKQIQLQLNAAEETRLNDTTNELDDGYEDDSGQDVKKVRVTKRLRKSSPALSSKAGATKRSRRASSVTRAGVAPVQSSGSKVRGSSAHEGSCPPNATVVQPISHVDESLSSGETSRKGGELQRRDHRTENQNRLMKCRHVLQKTFIKDRAFGDQPRASPGNLESVDWNGVVSTLEEFLAYVEGPQYCFEAIQETKLPKVVRMIANAVFQPEVEAKLSQYDIRRRVGQVLDGLKARTAPGGARDAVPSIQDPEQDMQLGDTQTGQATLPDQTNDLSVQEKASEGQPKSLAADALEPVPLSSALEGTQAV